MQVSAIKTNFGKEKKVQSFNSPIQKKSYDANNETSFNLTTNNKKDLTKIYKNINEWKDFCHQQILDGKLDIIA